MKKVISAMKQDAYATADTINAEGSKAWTMSAEDSLNQLCMTGTLGRSFYASTKENVKYADTVLQKADAVSLAEAIVKGRSEGFIRTFNIMGLVYLSQKDIKIFQQVFDKVVLTGNDLSDFIDMTHQVRGFGRGIKNTIHRWIHNKTNPFYAMKYRKQIADGIRISRFKGEQPIFRYIMHHYKNEIDIQPALEEHEQLRGYEDCKKAIHIGDWDIATKLIKDHRLDPMSIIGTASVPDNVWDNLAEQMGTMMLLKYLNKLDAVGTIDRKPEVLNRLNCQNLQKARVFPFRLYIAYKNVENTIIRDHLAETLEEYTDLFDWDVYNKFNWVIAPDVSGSMCSLHSKGSLTPATVAGMFSGFLYKGLDNAIIVPWDTKVYPTLMGPRRDSVITHIDKIKNASGGGTRMELPVQYMADQGIKVDVFMLITDNEEWGDGWLEQWIKYKRSNPKAKAVLMRVDTYCTSSFSEEDAVKYDILQLFGYNDNSLRFIEFYLEQWTK